MLYLNNRTTRIVIGAFFVIVSILGSVSVEFQPLIDDTESRYQMLHIKTM